MVETYRARSGNSVVLKAPRRPSSGLRALGEGLDTLATGAQRAIDRMDAAAETKAQADHQVALIEQRRQRAAAIATGSGALVDMELAVNKFMAEAPTRQKPGAVGYRAEVEGKLGELHAQFMAGLPEDQEVRQHFQGQLDRHRGQVLGAADEYERKSFAAWQGDSADKLAQAKIGAVLTSPNQETLSEALVSIDAMLDAMDLDGTTRERLRAAYGNRAHAALLDGLNAQGNWQAVRDIVASKDIATVLTPEQIKGYAALADRGEAAAAAEAERAANAAQAEARDALRLLEQRDQNDGSVTPSEWMSALEQAKAAGLDAWELEDWRGKAGDGTVTNRLRQLRPEQLDATVIGLQEKRQAGKLTGAEARQLDLAEKEQKARTDKAGAQLAPLLKGPPEMKMQGLAVLRSLPADRAWAVARAAGQDRMAVVARLDPTNGQPRAIQGAALRAERPADFLPPKSARVTDPRKEAERIYRAELGGLVGDLGATFGEHMDVALDLMAATAGGWNEGNFKTSIRIVTGASKRADGSLQGGLATVQGRKVFLPDQWTAEEFDLWYSRNRFEGPSRSGESAVYSNGSPVDPVDIRQRYQLRVADELPDGSVLYRLEGPDGLPLRNVKGGIYSFRVSAKPPAQGGR